MFRSITNKIALALMILLIISFCAISAVSYFTSEKKVIELVSEKEEQVLKDIKGVTDTFFGENLEYVKKSSAVIDGLQSGDEIMNFVLLEKKISNSIITYVYYGDEDGRFFQSDGKKQPLLTTTIQELGAGIKEQKKKIKKFTPSQESLLQMIWL